MALDALPDEEVPKQRLEFEEWRRNGFKKAIEEANKIG